MRNDRDMASHNMSRFSKNYLIGMELNLGMWAQTKNPDEINVSRDFVENLLEVITVATSAPYFSGFFRCVVSNLSGTNL